MPFAELHALSPPWAARYALGNIIDNRILTYEYSIIYGNIYIDKAGVMYQCTATRISFVRQMHHNTTAHLNTLDLSLCILLTFE